MENLVTIVIAAALCLFFLRGYLKSLKKREEQARKSAEKGKLFSEGPKSQHPHIDTSQCIGCATCVKACPEGVLRFVNDIEPLRKHIIADDLFTPGVGLCSGCPIETVSRFTGKVLGDNIVIFGTPGCCSRISQGVGLKASARVPCYFALMTNAASTAAGASGGPGSTGTVSGSPRRCLPRAGCACTCTPPTTRSCP